MQGAQLMTPIEGGMLEITGQGVDFLLKPRAEQVWCWSTDNFKNHAHKMIGGCGCFDFRPGYTTAGRSYAIAELSDLQQRAL